MTAALDVRHLPLPKRQEIAEKVRLLDDVELPEFADWNSAPCDVHKDGWQWEHFDSAGEFQTEWVTDRPNPGCRQCGVILRSHQRVGGLWLYMNERGLLADGVGTGKTFTIATLVSLMREGGELQHPGRGGEGGVVIIPRAPALHQWASELHRVMPDLRIEVADGPKKKREEIYMRRWEVLLVGPETFRNDYRKIQHFPIAALITDDVDAMRNGATATSDAIDYVGNRVKRFYITHATPMQKRLPEMYDTVDALGGRKVFGDKEFFLRSYVRYDYREAINNRGQSSMKKTIIGYQNLDEFKRKLGPLVLRRTADDLKDVTMPLINPIDVLLDLYPKQAQKYKELQDGVIQLLSDPEPKRVTALSAIHYGSAITAGLAALGDPDAPMTSIKMDWIIDKIANGGDLEDEKIVVFAKLKNSVRALQQRFRENGVGFTTIWGEEPNKKKRQASQHQFWDDPNCRVLIGTQAIEQSLNLQVSRYLINLDFLINPAKMVQLAGRIKRQGSAFATVNVINLLARNTHDERFWAVVEREAALANHIWDETGELFKPLTPTEMLRLITPGRV